MKDRTENGEMMVLSNNDDRDAWQSTERRGSYGEMNILPRWEIKYSLSEVGKVREWLKLKMQRSPLLHIIARRKGRA